VLTQNLTTRVRKGEEMDKKDHQDMMDGKDARNIYKVKVTGMVTAKDMDYFIRQGMTREEAHKAAMKLAKKKC
jgi:hypothetical protein